MKKIMAPIFLVLFVNLPLVAMESVLKDASDSVYSILDTELLIGSESAENLARKEMYEWFVGILPDDQILSVRGESGEVTRAIINLLPESLNNTAIRTMADSREGYKPPFDLDDDSIRFVFEYMQFGFAKIKLRNIDQAVEILHYAQLVMVPGLIIDLMTTLKDLPISPVSDKVIASMAMHFVNHFDTYSSEAQEIITSYLSRPENSDSIGLLLEDPSLSWHSLFKNTNLFGKKEVDCWGAYCTSHADQIDEGSFLENLDSLRYNLMTQKSYKEAIAPYSVLENQPRGAALWRLLCASSEKCTAKVDGVRDGFRSNFNESILTIEDVGNFVFIPEGTFQFGSHATEAHRIVRDINQRQKNVQGFFVAQHHVSNEFFHRVMGTNVADATKSNHPVVEISWNQADSFIERLNQFMEGFLIDGKYHPRFRMLSEIEWEYAARLATNHLDKVWATTEGEAELKAKNFWYSGNSQNSTQPVESYPPEFNIEFFNSEYPLYSILGNVYTWTKSKYDDSSYVLRGGSWASSAKRGRARLGLRSYGTPVSFAGVVGLRLAMDLVPV